MNRINGLYEREFGVWLELIADNDKVIYLDAATVLQQQQSGRHPRRAEPDQYGQCDPGRLTTISVMYSAQPAEGLIPWVACSNNNKGF